MYSLAVVVRATASVVISSRGVPTSALPYQISTNPVLCVIVHSRLPSAFGRMKPVSMAASRTLVPESSTIQARLM